MITLAYVKSKCHSIRIFFPFFRGFTKKAINYTAKKAGLKPKPSKRQKYVLQSWTRGNGGTLPAVNSKYALGTPLKQSPPSRDNLDGDDVSCECEILNKTKLSFQCKHSF